MLTRTCQEEEKRKHEEKLKAAEDERKARVRLSKTTIA